MRESVTKNMQKAKIFSKCHNHRFQRKTAMNCIELSKIFLFELKSTIKKLSEWLSDAKMELTVVYISVTQ